MRRKRGHQNALASGKSASGRKCRSPISRIAATGSSGIASRIGLGELADAVVDQGAAVGRAGRRVDGVERLKLQHALGVDGVGVAQPILDLGDAELPGPRRERRLRRGPRPGLARSGVVELARQLRILRAAFERGLPARLAGDRGEPLHEPRRHGRRAAELGRARQDHLARRRAPGRSRAPTARCAAPAGRGRACGASAG